MNKSSSTTHYNSSLDGLHFGGVGGQVTVEEGAEDVSPLPILFRQNFLVEEPGTSSWKLWMELCQF